MRYVIMFCLLLVACIFAEAKAQDICSEIDTSGCVDNPPDSGEPIPAPPIACPYQHPAVEGLFITLPEGFPADCDSFVIFGGPGEFVLLPTLKPFSREVQQAWADDAYNGGPLSVTHFHYAASWLNRFNEQKFYEGLGCAIQ